MPKLPPSENLSILRVNERNDLWEPTVGIRIFYESFLFLENIQIELFPEIAHFSVVLPTSSFLIMKKGKLRREIEYVGNHPTFPK